VISTMSMLDFRLKIQEWRNKRQKRLTTNNNNINNNKNKNKNNNNYNIKDEGIQ